MLEVTIECDADAVRIGERLVVSFHRTLRLPEDGETYPLPPGLGRLPIVRAPLLDAPGGEAFVVPLYRREAMWIGFGAAPWKPNAVKVIVGGINAVTGLPDDGQGLKEPQDYVVCPEQPWLDGFNAGDGAIRQFVAMPLGLGYAAEASFGRPERGGLRLVAFEPRPGRFPDEPPPEPEGSGRLLGLRPGAGEPARMALGAGGRMRQKIYPDPYGLEVWDQANRGEVELEIVDSQRFRVLTAREPPATPIDAATYTAHGLPWFDLYDEHAGSVPPPGGTRLKTIAERDAELGRAGNDEAPLELPATQVTTLRTRRRRAPKIPRTPEDDRDRAAGVGPPDGPQDGATSQEED